MEENGSDFVEKGDNSRNDSVTRSLSEADDSKKIFVGGISWESSEEELKEHFEQFGPVAIASIKVDKFSGQSRGFGFVVYEDETSVDRALAIPDHIISGKKVDPKRAKPQKEPRKKLFVGGIDPETKEDEIKEYFQKYGAVEKVEWPSDKSTGKRRAYVFVTLSTEEQAKAAAETSKQNISGRLCDVKIAVPPDQANRQRSWSQYQPSWGGGGGGSGHGSYFGGYETYDYAYGPYDSYGYDPSYYGYDYSSNYGYSNPNWQQPPPQPSLTSPRGGRNAPTSSRGGGGGKVRGGSRGGSSQSDGYHPYSRQ